MDNPAVYRGGANAVLAQTMTKEKAEPFFSIIVPCCDVEPYARACFDSVLKQPFADWECLAVVETSGDATEEIVRAYAAKDPRIKVFTQPRSGLAVQMQRTCVLHELSFVVAERARGLGAHLRALPPGDQRPFEFS